MAVDPGETELAVEAAPSVGENEPDLQDSNRLDADSQDTVIDGRQYPLHPKSVVVAQLTAAIGATSVGTMLLIAVLVAVLATALSGVVKLVILASWVVLAALAGVLCYRWPRIRYEHIKYRVDDNGFTVYRGVLWRSVTSVPKARVQHTDVSQGPLQRGYGLASLVIHTAGTQDSSVTLRGLPHEAAMHIRDYLIDGSDRIAV